APATSYLKAGDEIVSVDGVRGGAAAIARAVASHRCAGRPFKGCIATTAAHVVVLRGSRRLAFDIRPRYDSTPQIQRTRIGFGYAVASRSVDAFRAASLSVRGMWSVTHQTLGVIGRLFSAKQRKKLSGV